MESIKKKFVVCVLFTTLIGISTIPTPAKAILGPEAIAGIAESFVTDPIPPVPIADSSIRSKETSLTVFGVTIPGISWDKLALLFVRITMEQLSNSLVDWINRDFEGTPGFAVDPAGTFSQIADRVAGQAIADLGGGVLCQPFSIDIQNSVRMQFNRNRDPRPIQCTFTGIGNNTRNASQTLQNFLEGNFSSGGLPGFFQILEGNNNPGSAFLDASAQTSIRIQGAKNIELLNLNWSQGFYGKRTCIERNPNGQCIKQKTETPGAVVNSQLNKVLGAETDQLQLADEFDEVLSALFGQLMRRVFQGAGGLFAGGGRGYTETSTAGTSSGSSVSCRASKDRIVLGDEVTWNAVFLTPEGQTSSLRWLGEGMENASSTSSVTVRYTTPGEKTARIIVTRNGTQLPADCSNRVIVSRFSPLSVSCSVEPNRLQGRGAARWTATITGGSGRLAVVRWDGDDTGRYDGGPFQPSEVRNLTATTGSNPPEIVTVSNKMYIWLRGSGGTLVPSDVSRKGEKSAKITVVDQDETVAPIIDMRCQETLFIF